MGQHAGPASPAPSETTSHSSQRLHAVNRSNFVSMTVVSSVDACNLLSLSLRGDDDVCLGALKAFQGIEFGVQCCYRRRVRQSHARMMATVGVLREFQRVPAPQSIHEHGDATFIRCLSDIHASQFECVTEFFRSCIAHPDTHNLQLAQFVSSLQICCASSTSCTPRPAREFNVVVIPTSLSYAS
jgi:hypothetical protein